MEHTIPTGNWTSALAAALESAKDGDAIIVHDEAMQRLALLALEDLRRYRGFPYRRLRFPIEAPPDPSFGPPPPH